MRISFLATLFFLTSCASVAPNESNFTYFPDSDTEEMRTLLLGKWTGSREENGTLINWTVDRGVRGAYEVVFLQSNEDGTKTTTEIGSWGVRKPIYFTAVMGFKRDGEITPADGTQPSYYDAYQIIELNESTFVYRSYSSGTVFRMKKVDESTE